jgi:hypothetical protein
MACWLIIHRPQKDSQTPRCGRLQLRATILPYPAESIINWRTQNIGGVKRLSLVVLREPTMKYSDDGFEAIECIYHRVLRMEDGIYVQNLYDENNELISFGSQPGNSDDDEYYGAEYNIYPRKIRRFFVG